MSASCEGKSSKFCFLQVISSSGSAEISRNVVSGSLKLNDFTMSLRWSKIGDFHMRLIQVPVSVLQIPLIRLNINHLPVFWFVYLSYQVLRLSSSRTFP